MMMPRILVLFLCTAAIACSNNKNVVAPPPAPSQDTTGIKIVPWITTADESILLKRQPAVAFTAPAPLTNVIEVDSTQRFQEMDGFGYTLTGGSAIVINKMPSQARARLLTELFGDENGSISIDFLRISIGASDLSATVYTYNDIPAGETDPDLGQFSLANDQSDLIPLLKQIIAINPQIKILATPWTPPAWMKDNQSSIGGSLKPEYYNAYAQYFVKYIQAMKSEGISIYAVTPQNEPLHPENNPSMLMLAEQQAEFIRDHLGPSFAAANLGTKIIIYDHNCDKPQYPLAILNDAAAKTFIDGSAFHLYAGDISAMSHVKQAHPDKNIYFTEQYTAVDGSFGGDLRWHMRNLIVGAPRNWSKTVLEWNLANDALFGPHTPGGCTTCKGALTIDGSAVKRNVAYYIIAHASQFVPAGSVRIASNIAGNIHNVAYKTPAGDIVVVALNDGDSAAGVTIRIGSRSGNVTIPGGAACTLVIED